MSETQVEIIQESQKPKSKAALSMENILLKIDELETTLLSHRKSVDTIVNDIKLLKKQVRKHAKRVSTNRKAKSASTSSKPHGFAVPTVVSAELCTFMGLEENSLVARTTVTTALRNYIKEHQLQNPENKREILPDAKLAALFGEEAKDVRLNMFNMQKYINRHFPSKKTAIEVVA